MSHRSLAFLLSSMLLAPLAPLALAGCASDPSAAADEDAEDVQVSQDELSIRSRQFVGTFEWNTSTSGSFVDFEELALRADGTYTAEVEATLINPAARCIMFPCTLPEAGTWTTVTQGGRLKIRVNPYGPRLARSYFARLQNDTLSLTRFGRTTKLAKRPGLTCANVRCAAGTHCEMKGINGGSIPVCIANPVLSCATMLCAPGTNCVDGPQGGECVPVVTCASMLCMVGTTCVDKPTGSECVPNAPAACRKTGCSSHLCSDQDLISTCEFRPEYACYQQATCERQADGNCGFTPSAALTSCLANP